MVAVAPCREVVYDPGISEAEPAIAPMAEYGEVRLTDDHQKLYGRLLASHDDITFARYCAGVLLKKGWHNQPWERRGTVYEQQSAYTTALVTSYGRPFTRSKGWPPLPSDFITYDDTEIALHAQIMNLRHTVYAHSDSASFSIRPWRMGTFKTTIVGRPVLRITASDTTLFLAMSNRLLSSINGMMDDILADAEVIPISLKPNSATMKEHFTIHRRRK